MSRFTTFAIAAGLTGGLTGSARAQSQAELAAQANEEGKELMYADKYAEAAKKFQEAVARVPEPKYFVNLCTARLQEGKLDEALTACDAVARNNPTPDQQSRADKLIGKINDEARKQGLALHPTGGGGQGPVPPSGPSEQPPPVDPSIQPTQPPPNYTPAVGRPLETNLVATRPDNRYTWTLGFDVFGGGGRVGQSNYYGTAVAGFRLKGDYLVDPINQWGTEGYLQVSHFGQGSRDLASVDTLDIIDVGVAGYKHFCLDATQRLCLTPLAGVHLSLMSPAGSMDETGSQVFNYAGLGGRLEVSLTYAFGQRHEHVLALTGGANLYTRVLSGPSMNSTDELSINEVGLNQGGATGYLGLGYTYRFNTPLGSSPFVILE